MKDVNWIANTTRGTNDFIHCSHLVYLYDQNINPVVARWFDDGSRALNDAYAFTELIQWVWRPLGQEREANHALSFVTQDAEVV